VPRKQHLNYGRWFAMNQDVMAALTQFKRLEDYRVLFALLERLDFENFINASQADIANELEMHRSSVNQAIKRLIASEAVIEGPKVGINRTYRLNPNFGWKGSVGNHKKAVSDQMRQRMEKAGIVGVVENGR
jgi:predicted transcriptional regulator